MEIDIAQAQQIQSSTDEQKGVCNGPVLPNRSFEMKGSGGALNSPFQLPNGAPSRPELVRGFPETLKLHPALVRLNLLHSVNQLSRVNGLKGFAEPVMITSSGTIIGGFSEWHQAISHRRPVVACLEYSLTDEEALEFILTQHRSAQYWNDFTRIRLALELESSLQKKALDNQAAGGKYKGLANLPNPEHIDVRRDIARIAGVGSRNVSNVKTILRKAHPALIQGLSNGTLRIHRALHWCTLSQTQQREQFAEFAVQRATKRSIRHSLASLMKQKVGSDTFSVLRTLRNREVREPGSLLVRRTRLQRTVILLGRDFLGSDFETESNDN